jgi:Tfp pilus assembly protein PilN
VANNLNLASRPFNNRLLPWLLTFGVLFVSLIGLLIVIKYTYEARREAASIQAEINSLRAQEQTALNDARKVVALMSQEQLQALQGAHQLVDRKGFSWTRLLSDLEAALPSNVRVSRIAVRDVGLQGDQMLAELELAVFAKSSTSVTDMIADMDRDGIFRAELRAQNLQKGRGESGTEYELFVVYRPRPGYATENVASVQDTDKAREESK